MIIGIDIGGTHTDAVCVENGAIVASAIALTGEDLVASIIGAISSLGVDYTSAGRVVLSTTLSTNAIVEKTYARAGMLISAGPGLDPHGYFLSDDFFLIEGAVDHRGNEYRALDVDQADSHCRELARRGIRNLGIVSKFSVRNPAHELAMHAMAEPLFSYITLGHLISGSLNFPRRINTAYFNSAVMPIQSRFLGSVKDALNTLGIRCPLLFLKADGGTFSSFAAERLPVETILSGPAASMMGAVALSRDTACTLVLDIGGTTTDIGILIDGLPILEPAGISVGGLKTSVRGLKMSSIGIGGDSQVRLENGEPAIGPWRKGPPVCLGGRIATPMDALAVLGRFKMGDSSRAAAALEPLAQGMQMSLQEAAEAIVSKTAQAIYQAATAFIDEVNAHPVYTIEEMLHPSLVQPERVMIIGAPAATLQPYLEECFALPCIVPPQAAVANALGAALARTTARITLLADTQRRRFLCPELDIEEVIPSGISLEEVRDRGLRAIEENAQFLGLTDDVEVDIVESHAFNMVSGFRTVGRNMRLKLQTRPGLIKGW